jgi:hypothetical protein
MNISLREPTLKPVIAPLDRFPRSAKIVNENNIRLRGNAISHGFYVRRQIALIPAQLRIEVRF